MKFDVPNNIKIIRKLILLILIWLLFFSICLYYLKITNKVIVASLISGFIVALVETILRFFETSKLKK